MTTDQKHTPEPWRTEPNGPCYNLKSPDRVDHFLILVGMLHNNPNELAANARRIIACVNACKGIADPPALCTSHDRLRTNLRELIEDIEYHGHGMELNERITSCRTAITEAPA